MTKERMAIQIDGKDFGPGDVMYHYQSDPYPGGLSYTVRIPRSVIDCECWGYAKFETIDRPTEDQARHWFFWLPGITADQRDASSTEISTFVLNNIASMQVSETEIRFSGVASRWIGNWIRPAQS